MPSYAKPIADAVVNVLASLTGAPATVVSRKDNSMEGRDSKPIVIVSWGIERKTGRTTGGTVFKEYEIVVGIFRSCQADIESNKDLSPTYILTAKQALDKTSLAGVPVVWDIDLVDDPEWEHQPFGQGMEVSRFGLVVRTNEPQNG
jgi:hypothetical protein